MNTTYLRNGFRSAFLVAAASFATAAATFIAISPAIGQQPRLVVEANPDILRASARYDDLNLATPAGRSTLEGRVVRAVNQVCPSRALSIQLREHQHVRKCRRDAMASARPQIDAAVSRSMLMVADHQGQAAISLTSRR